MESGISLLKLLRIAITISGGYIVSDAITGRKRRDGWGWELMSGIELIIIATILIAGFGI